MLKLRTLIAIIAAFALVLVACTSPTDVRGGDENNGNNNGTNNGGNETPGNGNNGANGGNGDGTPGNGDNGNGENGNGNGNGDDPINGGNGNGTPGNGPGNGNGTPGNGNGNNGNGQLPGNGIEIRHPFTMSFAEPDFPLRGDLTFYLVDKTGGKVYTQGILEKFRQVVYLQQALFPANSVMRHTFYNVLSRGLEVIIINDTDDFGVTWNSFRLRIGEVAVASAEENRLVFDTLVRQILFPMPAPQAAN